MRVGEVHKQTYQVLALTLLYLIPAAQAMLPVDDPDIWWHLRTGQWIIQEGALPNTDPFSIHGEGMIWLAYSWLFEVIVYFVHSGFGLSGIVLFKVLFGLLIALALHALVRRARLPFVQEVFLVAIGLVCMKPAMTPRPWLFTIFFFILELHILLEFRKSQKSRSLYWLPVIFVAWANVHIQFVYGLAILIAANAEPWIERRLSAVSRYESETHPWSQKLFFITVMCIVATVVTPNHFWVYRPVFEYATQTRVFQNIAEFHPLFFRSLNDWVFLALIFSAVFVLGWRREKRLFPYFLLLFGAVLSFRARRDVWLGVVVALGVMADCGGARSVANELRLTPVKVFAVALAVGVSLFFFARTRNINERGLKAHVADVFPARAVEFVKQKGFAGPLYNHLDWGGFLIWSLPELKVSMDGRTNLHGEERIERSLAVWSGASVWRADPELARARVVIARAALPLTSFLREDSRFRLVHEDAVALVFVDGSNALKLK